MRYFILPLIALLSACGANHNSIHRSVPLTEGEGQVEFVDAKQRAVMIAPFETYERSNSGTVTLIRQFYRMCAEPSPDVFSVMASSLAADANVLTPEGTQVGASFSAAFSEAGVDIGLRTQTIQLMRDMMFRTCERFLNGQLNKDQYGAQAARDQRIIVALLAIEQLTGVVRPQKLVVSLDASANVGSMTKQAQEDVDAQKQKIADLEKELKAEKDKPKKPTQATPPPTPPAEDEKEPAPDAAAAAAAPKKPGETAPATPAPAEQAEEDPDKYQDLEKIARLEAQIADNKKTLESLEEYLKNARNLSAKTTGAVTVVTPPERQMDSSALQKVAEVVRDIAKMNFEFNDTQFFCFAALSKSTPSKEVQAICGKVFEESTNSLDDNQVRALQEDTFDDFLDNWE